MSGGGLSGGRILEKLDEYLHRNDYTAAERHLSYWRGEAEAAGASSVLLLICNEQMGLYRKLGQREDALRMVEDALGILRQEGIETQVGAATTYLNGATVYKAFGKAEEAIPLFLRAREIYERELAPNDPRMGGLYNNMGLALVDLGRFPEAWEVYEKALTLMEGLEQGAPEAAITLLNMADAVRMEYGMVEGDEIIGAYLDRAEELLERHMPWDGNYAFVCEKCASVFGYYGRFLYERELTERARRIYEHEGS